MGLKFKGIVIAMLKVIFLSALSEMSSSSDAKHFRERVLSKINLGPKECLETEKVGNQ